jgi:uncharacterized transporter YbjL
VVVIVWYLDLQLPMQSVPHTTKAVSLNTVHDEVYSKQHYMIKFVTYLRQVCGILRDLWIQRNWQRMVHKAEDEEKQNKNTTQYVLDTTMRKQTHMT